MKEKLRRKDEAILREKKAIEKLAEERSHLQTTLKPPPHQKPSSTTHDPALLSDIARRIAIAQREVKLSTEEFQVDSHCLRTRELRFKESEWIFLSPHTPTTTPPLKLASASLDQVKGAKSIPNNLAIRFGLDESDLESLLLEKETLLFKRKQTRAMAERIQHELDIVDGALSIAKDGGDPKHVVLEALKVRASIIRAPWPNQGHGQCLTSNWAGSACGYEATHTPSGMVPEWQRKQALALEVEALEAEVRSSEGAPWGSLPARSQQLTPQPWLCISSTTLIQQPLKPYWLRKTLPPYYREYGPSPKKPRSRCSMA